MCKYQSGLVSVIIPTYRRAEKLSRAIISVLNQTYKEIELFVINDNDPNDTYSEELKQIIGSFKDSRLKLIEQKKHTNGAVARNLGIKRAKGEYIAFLDDDDYWVENKIEEQVNTLSKLDPSWGGVSTKKKHFYCDDFIGATLPYKSGKIYEEILLRRIEVSTGTILLRHEALDRVGYYDESLNRHQELQLLSNFTYHYKIKLVNQYLHNADISDNQNRPNVEALKEIKKDFFISVKSLIDSLPKRKQKQIFIMHDFELGYAMIKNKQIKKGLIKCCNIFRSPFTIYYAIERITIRLIESKFKFILTKQSNNQL